MSPRRIPIEPGRIRLSQEVVLADADREAGRQALARFRDGTGTIQWALVSAHLQATLRLLASEGGAREELVREALAIDAALRELPLDDAWIAETSASSTAPDAGGPAAGNGEPAAEGVTDQSGVAGSVTPSQDPGGAR